MMTPSSMKKAPNEVKPTCHMFAVGFVSQWSCPAFVVQLDPNWAAAVAPEKSDRVAGRVLNVAERGGAR